MLVQSEGSWRGGRGRSVGRMLQDLICNIVSCYKLSDGTVNLERNIELSQPERLSHSLTLSAREKRGKGGMACVRTLFRQGVTCDGRRATDASCAATRSGQPCPVPSPSARARTAKNVDLFGAASNGDLVSTYESERRLSAEQRLSEKSAVRTGEVDVFDCDAVGSRTGGRSICSGLPGKHLSTRIDRHRSGPLTLTIVILLDDNTVSSCTGDGVTCVGNVGDGCVGVLVDSYQQCEIGSLPFFEYLVGAPRRRRTLDS